jgi:iron(III) transport system substrate-binding protein
MRSARSSSLTFGVATTVIAALALTACTPASTPDDTGSTPVSTPVSDGSFVLYSGRDEALVQPLIDTFEAATDIEVEVRYGNTAELAALLIEEGDESPAQVYLSQDAGALGALSDAGLFSTLPTDVTESVPTGFTSTDGSWVGVTGRARVIAYDSAELDADAVPTSIDAFAEPEWNGRVAIAPSNASFQSFVTAYRVLKGEEAADAWVAGLAANNPQIFDSNRAILSAVNDGVVDVGLINHYYWFAQAAETGVDSMRAQLSYPAAGDPGSIVNVTGAGILSSGATDADALEFVRYLVSTEAQDYFVDETFEYPLVDGIDAPDGLPALDSLENADLDLADLASLAETQALLAQYGLI